VAPFSSDVCAGAADLRCFPLSWSPKVFSSCLLLPSVVRKRVSTKCAIFSILAPYGLFGPLVGQLLKVFMAISQTPCRCMKWNGAVSLMVMRMTKHASAKV
jgi:hypothetical protein